MKSHVLHILGCGCLLFLECQHEEGGCGYLQWDTGGGGSEADLGCVAKQVLALVNHSHSWDGT